VSFTAAASGVALQWPDGSAFTGQSVQVSARPWSLSRLKVVVVGGFAFTLPPGSSRPMFKLAGETLRGGASFENGAVPTALDLTADAVSGSGGIGVGGGQNLMELTASGLELSGSRPSPNPSTDTDIAFDLTVKLLDLSAPALEGNPLGAMIKQAAVHADLMGVPPRSLDGAGLKAWRDGGGNLDIKELSLQWGQLNLSIEGTAALDDAMQPEGAFTAKLSGFEPAIDALDGAGWIKAGAASLAKLALGITARPGPDGKLVVTTPLTIQNRRISAGPIKLGQVPELKLD